MNWGGAFFWRADLSPTRVSHFGIYKAYEGGCITVFWGGGFMPKVYESDLILLRGAGDAMYRRLVDAGFTSALELARTGVGRCDTASAAKGTQL